MSPVANRAQRRLLELADYQPPDGFVQVGPARFEPDGYEPSPWELSPPDIESAADAEREYLRCADDLAYFAFHHCWTLHVDDVSGEPTYRHVPAYPYLRRFFRTVQVPRNTHVEKSRQMLLSWVWMVTFLWDITFHDNWSNMVLSRRWNEVDDGGANSTPDSLLGKVRAIWSALPPYLQQPLDFRSGIVRHIGANSFIRGEVGTPKAGRGRANKRALMDEAAYIERSESIFKGLRQAAKEGTILSSTPNGKGNVFARIRFNPQSSFVKLSFRWIEHPDKAAGLYCTCGWTPDPASERLPDEQFTAHECANLRANPPKPPEARSPWYDHECQDLTPEAVASELDIGYDRSRRGRVWKAFDSTTMTIDHQAVVGERDVREPLDPYRAKYLRAMLKRGCQPIVGWDFGVADATSLLLGQVIDDKSMTVEWIDEFENTGEGWEHYHAFVNAIWAPIAKEATGLDIIHYGDPTGANRESDLKSWVTNLRSREPAVVIVTVPNVGSRLEWLDFIDTLIRKRRVWVSTWCAHLLDVFANYHYPTDDNGEPIPGKQLPVHDIWSHAATALVYAYSKRYADRLPDLDHKRVHAGQMLEGSEVVKPVKIPTETPTRRSVDYF